uniref:Sas10 C-terminal domain-containing protein n=1 Tax=Percolomonas cosmopolitus TaxID=63605 RepID=A0A7S1KLM3_9EUKA|eukprot:CAMPEP_0117449616 /NCGR_PEP_ID=MMETSP0759-20121206/8036_1 /TAXON_ID=63605 /ORGANISM="Percolomonas cosmopolitus, Strain WS" /LENGTH=726 /DNA_ID=CAMNT_0005242095 /DNA_START=107 /DNA_END=2287 /DNA_ORIENTATION=+
MTQKLISTSLKHHKKSLKKHVLSSKAKKTLRDERLRAQQVHYETSSSDDEHTAEQRMAPKDSSSSLNEATTTQLLAKSKALTNGKQSRDSNDNERLKPIYRGAWSDDEDSSSEGDAALDTATRKSLQNGKSSKTKGSKDSSEDENSDDSSSDDKNDAVMRATAASGDSDSDSSDSDSNIVSNQKWNKRDLHASSKRDGATNKDATFEDKQQEAKEANLLQKKRAERLRRAVESDMNEEYASESEEDSDESADEQTNDELERELVTELKEKLSVLQNQLQPLLRKVKNGGYATDEGLSYLETKYQLLLSYCMNLVYFLTLKASGKSVEDHPVIEYLVEQRKLLEKIKPIDDRMKYQLQKLVQIATTTETVQDTNPAQDEMSDEESASDSEESDSDSSAAQKPNIKDFMEQNGDAMSDSSDEDDSSDEEEAAMVRASLRKKAKESGNQETYVAPKLMAVASNVDKREKKLTNYEKRKEKLKQRLADSGILQDIMEDFGDAPIVRESVGTMKKSGSKAVRFAHELEEYEMKNMKRVQLNKQQKKLLREAEENLNNFDDELKNLDAFSEYVAHEAKAKDVENEKVTLLEYLGNEEEARHFLNEQDNQEEKNSRKRKRIQEPAYDSGSDQSDIVDDMGPQSKKIRRLAEDKKLHVTAEVGRRSATKKELQNRGIRANKRKDLKNSRVKFKKRYDAKTAPQRNLVQQMEKLRGGSGALPSVNANVVRSRKAK